LLTYESNRVLGPTLTGTVSSTAPLFAVAFAVLLLDEPLTMAVGCGASTIVAALAVLSWRPQTEARLGKYLLLPLAGAALRALAQTLTKLGLALWASPFAATLTCYTVSGVAIWGVAAARPPRQPLRSIACGIPWFMAAGVLNGCALLFTNHALNQGRVGIVAPLVALYPLFTMLFSTIFLKTESFGRRIIVGALMAVAGVVILVSG
jgi:drug/metabolite transporter (DMT)-like permease